ncbi:hypothetical protein SprV_0200530700 [Sparganum proliferum]
MHDHFLPPAAHRLFRPTSEQVSLVLTKPVAGVLPNRFDAGAPAATLSARPLLGQMPLPPRPVVFQHSHAQTFKDKDSSPKKKRCRSQAAKARRPQATGTGSSKVVAAKHPKKLRTDGSATVVATPISQAFLLAPSDGTSSSSTFPLLCSLSAPSYLHSSYSGPAGGGQHCVAATMTPQCYDNHLPPLLPWSGIRPNFQSPPSSSSSSCQPDSQPHRQPLEEGAFIDRRFAEPPFPPRPTAPSRAFCSAVEQPSATHNAFLLLSSQTRLPGSILIQPPSDGTTAVRLPTSRPQFPSPAPNGSPLMSYPPYSCAFLLPSAIRMSHDAGVSSGKTSDGPLSNRPSMASHVRYSQPPPIVVPTWALRASHRFSSNIAAADGAHCLSFQPIDAVPVTASSSLDWAVPPARPVSIAPHFLPLSSASAPVRGAAPAWSAPPRFPHPQTAPTQQHPSCSLVPLQNSSSIISALSESYRHQSQRPPLNSAWTTTAVTMGLPTRLIDTPGVTSVIPRLPHPGSIPDCPMACGQGLEYPTLSGAQRLQSQFLHHTENYLGTAPKAVPSPSVTRAISCAPTTTSLLTHLLSLANLQGGQSQGRGSSASRPLLPGQNSCTEVAVTCAPPTTASVAPQQQAVCHWMPAGGALGQRPPQPSPPSRPQVVPYELGISQPLLPVGQVERRPTHSVGSSKLMAMLLPPNGPRGDCLFPIVCPLCSFSDTSRQAMFKHISSAH